MVLNSFQDPHPRVRWAAINEIGQLSTDLGPNLEVQFHSSVLPTLAAAMDDFQNPRIQCYGNTQIDLDLLAVWIFSSEYKFNYLSKTTDFEVLCGLTNALLAAKKPDETYIAAFLLWVFLVGRKSVKGRVKQWQKHYSSRAYVVAMDGLMLSSGFQPAKFLYLDESGVNFSTRTTYEDTAITNAIDIYDSMRKLDVVNYLKTLM
nr:importin subunit beta-3-like isoform X1 [Ipomoea batatas]